jgi:Flp pilus assembly protein TadD
MTQDEIQLDIAEKTNVANVLISNLVHQTIETARAATEEAYKEHSVGFEIASQQLGKFVSTLIMENGNMQFALDRNHIHLAPEKSVNNVTYSGES